MILFDTVMSLFKSQDMQRSIGKEMNCLNLSSIIHHLSLPGKYFFCILINLIYYYEDSFGAINKHKVIIFCPLIC